MVQTTKQAIEDYWEREACGERYGDNHDRVRYQREPEILQFAAFGQARGASVLEIGVGMGTDFMRWLRAGATAMGIDLTGRAIELTAALATAEGFKARLCPADAEALPFSDATFDLVYSWGVLHHTPDTSRAFREAVRVLRPGGTLKVMVYHRYSWVAAAAWVRFCLLRGHLRCTLTDALSAIESPGTKAFTVKETRAMVPGLDRVTVEAKTTFWDQRYFPLIHRFAGNRLGWFLLIEGTKCER